MYCYIPSKTAESVYRRTARSWPLLSARPAVTYPVSITSLGRYRYAPLGEQRHVWVIKRLFSSYMTAELRHHSDHTKMQNPNWNYTKARLVFLSTVYYRRSPTNCLAWIRILLQTLCAIENWSQTRRTYRPTRPLCNKTFTVCPLYTKTYGLGLQLL